MPMSPRLLRPILSGDPDALRYIAAVQAADQQSLEPAVRKAITDFIVGCKQDGIWGDIANAHVLMGARSLAGALVPLVGGAPANNNFVTADYSRTTGLKGNGSNKVLVTSFLANTLSATSHHLFLRGADLAETSGDRVWCGSFSQQSPFNIRTLVDLVCRDLNNVRSMRSGSASTGGFANVNMVGRPNVASYSGERTAANALRLYENGVNVATSTATNTPILDATPIAIFARLDNFTNPNAYSASRFCFFSVGNGLGATKMSALHSRTLTLQQHIQAALP